MAKQAQAKCNFALLDLHIEQSPVSPIGHFMSMLVKAPSLEGALFGFERTNQFL